MRATCQFVNPVDGSTYVWPINYLEDNSTGKERTIEVTANTGNVGLVRQQGDDQPLTLAFSGTILTQAHLDAFWLYYILSESQTIYFDDVDGTRYEVQITKFVPKKQRGRNPANGTGTSGLFYWKYDMEMTVYTVVSGPLAFLGSS